MTTFRLSQTLAASLIAGVVLFVLAARPASTQSGEHLETVHHPGYDTTISMPFVPAIKIKSGKLLWLSGGTALPVYHDHPHRRDQILKYLPNDLEAQVRSGRFREDLLYRLNVIELQLPLDESAVVAQEFCDPGDHRGAPIPCT